MLQSISSKLPPSLAEGEEPENKGDESRDTLWKGIRFSIWDTPERQLKLEERYLLDFLPLSCQSVIHSGILAV